MTRKISVQDPAVDDRIDGDATGGDRRPPRPSDMRILHLWQPPNRPSRYRVDFFNTFARGPGAHKVCQRSIVIDAACCAEEAREIAKARFAEIERICDWHIHAAEIEVVPIIDAGPPVGGDALRTGPALSSQPEQAGKAGPPARAGGRNRR
jgi:hypothetical protein